MALRAGSYPRAPWAPGLHRGAPCSVDIGGGLPHLSRLPFLPGLPSASVARPCPSSDCALWRTDTGGPLSAPFSDHPPSCSGCFAGGEGGGGQEGTSNRGIEPMRNLRTGDSAC